MYKISNLSKQYQRQSGVYHALDNINLEIAKGEIFGIVGHSGAGKSTLLHCLNGLTKPSSGHVLFNGHDLTTISAAQLRQIRQKIGMIFQHFNLLGTKTVYDNVALPLKLAHYPNYQITAKVNKLLELVGIADKAQAYPAQLSGGQKQRVAIARALVNEPLVLLCDEATSSLDPESTNAVLDLLKKISQEMQLTVILITHEMHVIKKVCDRVALIDAGKIVEQAAILDFFFNPSSAIGKAFVKSSLTADIPEFIAKRLQASGIPIISLIFSDSTASQPIITNVIKDYQVSVNIIQANIESIHGNSIGQMLIELSGNDQNCNNAIQYLQQLGLTVEIVGYVANDDQSNH